MLKVNISKTIPTTKPPLAYEQASGTVFHLAYKTGAEYIGIRSGDTFLVIAQKLINSDWEEHHSWDHMSSIGSTYTLLAILDNCSINIQLP